MWRTHLACSAGTLLATLGTEDGVEFSLATVHAPLHDRGVSQEIVWRRPEDYGAVGAGSTGSDDVRPTFPLLASSIDT